MPTVSEVEEKLRLFKLRNSKIEAIKYLFELSGHGLKTCKDEVESYFSNGRLSPQFVSIIGYSSAPGQVPPSRQVSIRTPNAPHSVKNAPYQSSSSSGISYIENDQQVFTFVQQGKIQEAINLQMRIDGCSRREAKVYIKRLQEDYHSPSDGHSTNAYGEHYNASHSVKRKPYDDPADLGEEKSSLKLMVIAVIAAVAAYVLFHLFI